MKDLIYAAIIEECERLEHEGAYIGTGHHLAQRLSVMAEIGLLPKQQAKIYKQLPSTSREIGSTLKLKSNAVSAQLKSMKEKGVVTFKDGKWWKN